MKITVLLCLTLSLFISAYAGDNNSVKSNKQNNNIYMPVFSDGYVRFVDSSHQGKLLIHFSQKNNDTY
jgi:hypothetical protein